MKAHKRHSDAPRTHATPFHRADRKRSAIGAVVLVALALLLKALFPTELPAARASGFVDVIFINRTVIWAARVVLVSATVVLAVGGVFTVSSAVMRMRNGDWLTRVGPFEVSEGAVAQLQDQIEYWRTAALEGEGEAAELRRLLESSDELIEHCLVRDS